jgi:Domain of unknown function (DUF6285)
MPANRPDCPELLQAVRELLEQQFLPALEDKALLYQCRVAINILHIVERELQGGAALLEGERRRLAALLGEEADLETLNARLVRRIRAGEFDEDDAALLAHLLATTLDKLAIDNPGYATYRDYLEHHRLDNH